MRITMRPRSPAVVVVVADVAVSHDNVVDVGTLIPLLVGGGGALVPVGVSTVDDGSEMTSMQLVASMDVGALADSG